MSAVTTHRHLWTMASFLIGIVLFGAALGLALASAYEQSSLKWLLMALALIAAAGSAIALFDVSRWSRSQLAPASPWRAATGGVVSSTCMFGVGLLSHRPTISAVAIFAGVVAFAAALAQLIELIRERNSQPRA